MSSSENLIFLLNKLSYHIVARALIQEENDNQNAKDEKFFKMCVNKIRQKGCDVLLGKSIVAPLPDPCVTNYGGNWSPFVLLSDYGKELEFKGGSKLNSILSSSVKCLEEKEYNYANELLKFLLMIKGPFFDPQVQVFTILLYQHYH